MVHSITRRSCAPALWTSPVLNSPVSSLPTTVKQTIPLVKSHKNSAFVLSVAPQLSLTLHETFTHLPFLCWVEQQHFHPLIICRIKPSLYLLLQKIKQEIKGRRTLWQLWDSPRSPAPFYLFGLFHLMM